MSNIQHLTQRVYIAHEWTFFIVKETKQVEIPHASNTQCSYYLLTDLSYSCHSKLQCLQSLQSAD